MAVQNLALIAVMAPLFGFFLSAVGSLPGLTILGDRFAQLISCAFMLVAVIATYFLIDPIITQHQPITFTLLPWINVGDFKAQWGFKIDTLSLVMMCVVNTISFLVHVYSIGYMSQDHSIPRFMGYLSLFTFMMLMLVTATNFVQLFFGWEGVGLASYLLIGFWYERQSANAAAIKAFIVNRIGDVGLALGIAAIFMIFKTVEFDELFVKLADIAAGTYAGGSLTQSARPLMEFWGNQWDALTVIGILLVIGAMGKSAQLGLHTWLADAMEGPTPVSALIHAATMVTAGVFLICRLSPLYELAPLARDVIVFVGAITSIFAGTVALTQTDIKRTIAFTTSVQLGFMFFSAGCSAYGAAIFHLVTHAFFKALLFLGAGSVIHAMSDEQDMTRMGGIYRLIPKTYALMWIGTLAAAGIPYFSGYYSKHAIVDAAYLTGTAMSSFAFYAALVGTFMTAFYSWRLLLLTFHGSAHADERVMSHVHESPWTMMLPLALLAVGAIFSGYLGYTWFVGDNAVGFWAGSIVVQPHEHHEFPTWVIYTPLINALLGVFLAYVMYGGKRQLPTLLAQKLKILYQFSKNKWYFDEIFDALFVNRAFGLGNFFWKRGDIQTIDRFGPDGMTKVSLMTSRLSSHLQTGYVYHYAFAMIVGLMFMIGLYLYQGWGGYHVG